MEGSEAALNSEGEQIRLQTGEFADQLSTGNTLVVAQERSPEAAGFPPVSGIRPAETYPDDPRSISSWRRDMEGLEG